VTKITERRQLADDATRLRGAVSEIERLFPSGRLDKVLLISPPDADSEMFNYETAKRGRYWNFPPYGLGVIASHLRADGVIVEILNLNHQVLRACRMSSSKQGLDFDLAWSKVLIDTIDRFQPEMVGITCMFTQGHRSTMNVCNKIRELFGKLPIALGGVHITNSFLDEEISSQIVSDFSSVDLFFLFEAELALKQFIKVVNGSDTVDTLKQVHFHTTNGGFYFDGKMIPEENDLDIIPAHDSLDTKELTKYGVIGSFYCLKAKNSRITTVLSNRGCRARCTFCSVRNFNGKSVRTRSIQSVIDELLMLREEYDIDHIMWLDDDLFFNHKRSVELFEEMIKQDVGLTWDCTNGVIAASCNEELISVAAESGCLGLTIGVESGNPEILKKIKKPGTTQTFFQAAEVLRKFEQINARVFLMIGFPGETKSMMLDTVNLALAMDLDWYNITICQPLPNTPLFETMTQAGLIDDVDLENIRYSSGPYGKIRQNAERDFFVSDSLDEIWFRMNYYLNFERLYKIGSPVKLVQQFKYVQNIAYLVAPDDAFAIYFCGYMQNKVLGYIDKELTDRLENCLQTSAYWRTRFDEFNLSVDHLKRESFPGMKQSISLSRTY